MTHHDTLVSGDFLIEQLGSLVVQGISLKIFLGGCNFRVDKLGDVG